MNYFLSLVFHHHDPHASLNELMFTFDSTTQKKYVVATL